MKIIKQSVGADIAKDKFDACFSVLTSEQRVVVKATRKFANTPKGFIEFGQWWRKWEDVSVELIFIMEATGVYYENLAWQLHQADRKVIVVLPNAPRNTPRAWVASPRTIGSTPELWPTWGGAAPGALAAHEPPTLPAAQTHPGTGADTADAHRGK